MIPVRRIVRSNEREVGVRELGDEHRRHAVERRAALLLHRLERRARLEGRAPGDHAGAVGDAAEVAHDHAEAVVERHGDADAVVLRVAAQLADEEPVVEDVVVAERRALGEAGGAARVLDVDRVVELQARGAVAQRLGVGAVRLGEQLVPVGRAEEDDALERREVAADLVDHRDVVRGLERLRADEQPAAGLLERVGELGRPVGGVDVHEDDARLRGRELRQRPLGAVRRPDADAVADLEPRGHERASEPVGRRVELRVGHAGSLVARDERRMVGKLPARCAPGAPRSSRR